MKKEIYVRVQGIPRQDLMNTICRHLEYYFEGVPCYSEPIDNTPISTFGIRDIDLHWTGNKKNQKFVITIQLSRPGLFIGKRGATIKALESYLKESIKYDFNFSLVECPTVIQEYTNFKKLKVIPNEIEFWSEIK